MKPVLTFLLALTVAISTTNSWAADCPHEYQPPKHKAPPKRPKPRPPLVIPPAPVVPAPPAAPCACKGEQGPPGEDGRTIIYRDHLAVAVVHSYEIGLTPRIGVMGFVQAPHGDWGWGPALQLEFQLSTKNYFVMDGAIALPADGADWSPGREAGYMLHGGIAHDLTKHFAATSGVYFADINGSSSNGQINGKYLGVDVGLVAKASAGPFNFRFELTPVIGGLRDTHQPDDTQFTIGVVGSAFLGVNL